MPHHRYSLVRRRGHRAGATVVLLGAAIVVVLAACSGVQAQTAAADAAKRIKIAAPADWTGEQIGLPPRFAPTMAWKGVEEVRFAPGMFKANSPTFFSYVFVFRLQPGPKITAKLLEQQLLIYYKGLATAVSNGALDVSGNTVKFSTVDLPGKGNGNGRRRFSGEVQWTEPFVTRKPQTLHIEADTWDDDKSRRRYLFVCVSPQPFEHAIWKQMRTIRKEFGMNADGK